MLKLLLDGTFPIHLSRRLKDEGMNVERLIVVGRATETYITDRLSREDDAVFVTEDPGRKTLAVENRGPVIISLVPQAPPLEERLELWAGAENDTVVEALESPPDPLATRAMAATVPVTSLAASKVWVTPAASCVRLSAV